MEKINIAELLKDCPKGMELDCTEYDGVVKFDGFNKNNPYTIRISVMNDGEVTIHSLTKYGQTSVCSYNKCVIFPKGKTTWEGFQRPFKVGDIVFTTLGNIAIIRKPIGGELFYVYGVMVGNGFYKDETSQVVVKRLATEEEKAKLFKAIKEKGYRWNSETKNLEKLVEPKFKVGDKIKRKGDTRLTTIKDIRDNCYIITIPDYFDNAYITDKLLFSNQNEYELVPNKFDITTLKPFDKVLVRGDVGQKWIPDFFGFMDKDKGYPYVCVRYYVIQCIPYEGNEHLLGKTDDCDEYFQIWR